MESLLSFLYGASMKVVDELMDVPNDYVNLKSFFQLFTISLYSILAYNDYLFSFIIIFITIGAYYAGSLDDPYWVNCGYIVVIIFIISVINKKDFIISEISNYSIYLLLFIILYATVGSIDNYLFPSEHNISKFLSSIFYFVSSVIGLLIVLYYENDYENDYELKTIKKLMILSIGHHFVRSIAKGYLYFTIGIKNNAELEIPKEESL